MAKRKTTHVLHMPVPAKIGFIILGIAVMVYAIFLATMYKEQQTINSSAYFHPHRPTPTPLPCRVRDKLGRCILR